ncbi:MAG: TonB-dependent receptor plug domain-containing protein [Pseudomonadota bacterium]
MSNTLSLSGSAIVALATALLAAPTSAMENEKSAAAETERQVSDEDSETRDAALEDKAGGTTARRSYTPEDFTRFAPRSALDMAQQVPGFQIREGDGARGLGAADTNVLINGRRISGKSNGPVAALQRIPAEKVVRLELVDGASLDIGGLTGQVLNVITSSSGQISGQFRYSPQFRDRLTPARLRDGEISVAGSGEKNEWNLALRSDETRTGNTGPEFVFDRDGLLIDNRTETERAMFQTISLGGGFTRVAENANILNLTGEVNGFFRRGEEVSERSGSISPVDRTRIFDNGEDEYNFELGADYQFKLGAGRLKLIAYHRYEDSPTFDRVVTLFADDSPAQGSVFDRDADEGETIARAEYNFTALGGDLLLSAEGVRNFLEINSELQVRDDDGVLQPIDFDGASARVEEARADIGATYSRRLTPKLQFQSSAGIEYSQISQSGPLGQTRSFYRPKGFVALDWRARKGLNLSGRVERVVGQLNFFEFIASVDLNQDRTDVTNADLVPPQSWVFEIEANLGLGALGSINLRPFYEDISDIVDQIPIEGGGQAPGNLPSASFYGLDGTVTLLSEGIGWRGTRFDAEFFLTGSSIRDPLLGNTRQLSGNDTVQISVDLRHDFQGTDWAVGGGANWEDNAPNTRLDEVALRTFSFPGFVSAFVENKDVAGLTLRAGVANIAGRDDRFDRTVFVDRTIGLVDFTENRFRNFGTIFTLDIEGSF